MSTTLRKLLCELVGSGTGSGQSTPDTASGDRLTGGDVASFQRRMDISKYKKPESEEMDTIKKWTNQGLKDFK